MRKIAYILSFSFIIILQSPIALAQISQYKFAQLFDVGFQYVLEEDYGRAEFIFRGLNKSDTEHGQVSYLLGMCQVINETADQNTIQALESASRLYNDLHQRGRVEDRTSPSVVWFYLAKAYESQGMLKEALSAYRTYTSCARIGSTNLIQESSAAISRLKSENSKHST